MKRALLLGVFCTLSVTTAGGALAGLSVDASTSALAAPSMKLTVTPSASGPWALRVQNTGETPVRIPADARLLSLEITPPAGQPVALDKAAKKGAPVGSPTCVLPDDARPSTDEGLELVIPATRGWSTTFDPLFYCFGARERAALVAGASVKARFGFKAPAVKGKTPAIPSPPFAVSPVGASVGKIAAVKMIEADPVTLPDAFSAKAPATGARPASSDAPAESKVYLTLPETMDAAKGVDLTTNVTLVNDSDRAVTLLFRTDMMQFTASGPGGSVACGAVRNIGSPMKELFVTVGAKGKTSMGVMFTATCGPGTFDQPGLYRLDAKLDTTQASGRSINVKTWDDVAMTKQPLLLRVREAHHPPPPARPNLD